MSDESPKLFVSYRWSSPEHEEWVLALAISLRSDGVDVILDKWHLKEGQDTFAFMERMVNDPAVSKVLLICDEGYVERANSRTGGVGTEAQIVSSEVYARADQTKFAAAVMSLDAGGKPMLPTYFATRLYFDFSNDNAFSENYEKVLRWCFNKPFHPVPPIGVAPKYLDETFSITTRLNLPSGSRGFHRSGAANSQGNAVLVLSEIGAQVSRLNLQLADVPDPDQVVVDTIEMSVPLREEAFEAIDALMQSDTSDESLTDILHQFIETISARWDSGPDQGRYTSIDNDALRFFVHSTFLGMVALGMKRRRFSVVSAVLALPMYRANGNDRLGKGVNYGELRPYLTSLDEIRKRRLNLNRLSVHADYILDTLNHSRVTISDIMEADFTLYLRSLLAESGPVNFPSWYPLSLIWAMRSYGVFPTFVRAASTDFYNRLKVLFGNLTADDLRSRLEPFVSGQKQVIQVDYSRLDIKRLANLDALATID